MAKHLLPGRLGAMAVLARHHARGAADDRRVRRSIQFVDRHEARFATVRRTETWLAQWALPNCEIDAAPGTDDLLIPVNLLAALAQGRRGRQSITIRGSQEQALVTLWLRGGRRRPRVLPDVIRAAGDAQVHVLVDGGTIQMTVPQEPIRRRLDGVLDEVAASVGVPRGQLVHSPMEDDGYLAFTETAVWKIRLPFMYGNKLGPLSNEWAALTHLRRHPAIVDAHSYDATSERELLRLERVSGETLAALVADDRLDGAQVGRTLLLLADVAAFLRENGVVHRDLQKENILVAEDGALHVIDFDQSVVVDPDDTPPDVRPLRRARPLVPWVAHRELVNGLGWRVPWTTICTILEEMWSETRGARFALELPDRVLPGDEPFWPRWHAVVCSGVPLAGDVALVGDDAGLMAALLSCHGAQVSVYGPDLPPSARRLFELLEVGDRVRFGGEAPTGSHDTVMLVGRASPGSNALAEALAVRSTAVLVENPRGPDATAPWSRWRSVRLVGSRNTTFTVAQRDPADVAKNVYAHHTSPLRPTPRSTV